MPNGKIQPKHKASLKAMGNWLNQNGLTIYGTRRGPIPPSDDFVSTRKGKKVYLHILNSNLKVFHIDKFPLRIKSSVDLKTKIKLDYRNDSFGFAIDITKLPKDDIDTIIEIELR